MTKFSKLVSGSALAIVTTILAMPATALADNTKCGAREEIIQLLEQKYKEGRVAVAISHLNTQAYEVFVSDKGTWTMMITDTNGATCIMAAGHSWEHVGEKIGGQKS